MYRAEAFGFSKEFMDHVKEIPVVPDRGTAHGRALLEGRAVHIPDVLADSEFTGVGYQSRGNYRSHLGIPMRRNDEIVGVFALTRIKVQPFSPEQIRLVETFAHQAVIAIENARLHEAEKERSRELNDTITLLRHERETRVGIRRDKSEVVGRIRKTILRI